MLHTFVSTQGTRIGAARLGVASFSVLAHAGLITVAVATSGRPSSTVDEGRRFAPAEQLQFVNVRDRERRTLPISRRALRAARNAARLIVPNLTKLRIAVDATIAALPTVPEVPIDLDIGAHTADARDFGEIDTSQLVASSAMWALAHPGPNGAYSEDVVERTAWPRNDNPRPRYPQSLKDRGVEGSFVVQFVVDSTGRVDAKTLNFPGSAHPAFLRAVKDALLHSRYFPAELAGLRVRQLVQQQFTFVLGR